HGARSIVARIPAGSRSEGRDRRRGAVDIFGGLEAGVYELGGHEGDNNRLPLTLPSPPPGARETLRAPLPRMGRGRGEGGVVEGHGRRIGRRKVKVEPAPSALVTQILPPCSSMNFRHRVSPRPVPCCLAALEPT